MTISEQKKQLRKQILERKKNYSVELLKQRSEEALLRLEQLSDFVSARSVLIYWSLPDELFTHDFIIRWSSRKTILLPAIVNDEIEIRKYTCREDLLQGKFCIAEPCGDCHTGQIDLAVIPGVAFDKVGNRLGRGKGYYDRFLSNFTGYKVGLCFDFQLLDFIPTEKFDIKMDKIISG
jgi:5-formyltetrahydrofolate cyclo-ligase